MNFFMVSNQKDNTEESLDIIRQSVIEICKTLKEVSNKNNPALPFVGSAIVMGLIYIGDCIRSKK